MHALSESDIRSSFVNTSQSERKSIAYPELDTVDWDEIDYFGWRDRKLALVGYVVAIVDGAPVGVLVKQAESKPRTRAQCSWCTDVKLPNDVVLFSAKRAGDAGRRGDTVGTLACAAFECSANARHPQPPAYLGFDVAAARERRIEGLQANIDGFVRSIRDGS